MDGNLMTLVREWRRFGARVLAPVMLCGVLLAACGGGTEQVQTFRPSRLIVFGDETSMIQNDGNNDGNKYGINDRSSTAAGKCQSLPIFVQAVATHYGLVFAQCNPLGASPKAFIQAIRLAKVDDPTTGLSQQVANQGDLNAGDMVTVMIGNNDIIELYERTLTGMSINDALLEAQRRGTHAAEKINAILATGARALVVTIPDLSLSPYGVQANLTNPGATGELAKLTYEFNAYLRIRIDPTTYDGRNYGLVLADDIVLAMARNPVSYLRSPAATNVAACANLPDSSSGDAMASAVLACNTTTLVTGAASNTHLWASDRHLGPNAHFRIGEQAVSRATNNPF
jgi:outer membrane lipase/esterase